MDKVDATRWAFTTKHIVFTQEGSQRLSSSLLNLQMFRDTPADPAQEYWWSWPLLIGVLKEAPDFMGPLTLKSRHEHPTAVFREAFMVRNYFMHFGLAVFGGDGDAHIEFWPEHIDTTTTE